jgi:hypothetical protein
MSKVKSTASTQNVPLMIARFATFIATQGGTRAFGAPVSSTQILESSKFIKAKKLNLKSLKCSEKELLAYAEGSISASQLPQKTREILREMNGSYRKPWARKSAAILYATFQHRKRGAKIADATK